MTFSYDEMELARARAMQAVPQDELQQRQIAQYAEAQQYKPTLADMSALQNYRRPVYVPPGFVDWYACGDELT